MSRYGFIPVSSEYVEEIKAEGHLYRHEKTGAELLHIPCEDNNKVFAVMFATHPQDDSGVAHILEHSVLSGSDKYPLREPFVTLMKTSINTFLNAMTFSDQTVYPFASQNEKDFMNLMDVYLDAVFHPIIYKDPLIFRQEGWHYEEDENGKVFYNGVVFNEMKGAMSSPSDLISESARKLLYDNIYANNSGGDPKAITDLSYEAFLDFHRTYYHPSNARFYLYGNMELDPVLKKINDEYIGGYEASVKADPVPLTTPQKQPRYLSVGFPSQDGSGFAGLQYVLGDSTDLVSNMAMNVISTALFGLESSPVRRSLLESGICQDLQAQADDLQRNAALGILLAGTRERDPEKIEKALLDAMALALKEENRELMDEVFEAALNNLAFTLREGETGGMPKGLIYAFQLLSSVNGGNPFDHLRYEPLLAAVQEEHKSGALYERIRKSLLENPHRATVVLVSDNSVGARMMAEEEAKVTARWSALSEEQREAERAANKALALRQATPDSPETLALMPALELSDIDKKNRFRDVKEDSLVLAEGREPLKLLHYDSFTSGIGYIGLHFPLEACSVDDLFALSVLSELLGQVDTEKRSYMQLTNAILSRTGGFSAGISVFPGRRFLSVQLKVLRDQLDDGLELMKEILTESRFDDAGHIMENLMMNFSRLQMDFIGSGNRYAAERVVSRFSEEAKAESATGGLDYYAALNALMSDYENSAADFGALLSELLKKVVNTKGLILSFIGEEADKELFKEKAAPALADLPCSEQPRGDWSFEFGTENEAFIMPSQVQYVAMGGSYKAADPEQRFTGTFLVLNALLNKDYLWNQARVKGGAYGAGSAIDRSGSMVFTSYRDPNCGATLEVFKGIPAYLRSLELSPEELSGYIIGTTAAFDTPFSPAREGNNAINRYFKGITLEQLQRERDEVLSTRVEDLRAQADLVEKVLAQNAYSVLGGAEGIRPDEKRFDVVQPIM